jgi:transposase
VVVDGLGNPLKVVLTEGQAADVTQGPTLLEGGRSTYVIGDKGYDATWFVELIEGQGSIAVIPPRKNRTQVRAYDEEMYKERHLVECFFNRIKQARRVATRYEKTQLSYLGMVLLACILVWLL